MRANDKLIRQNCPACHAEITLGSSSLNKKIHCPKCRNVVIIPAGVTGLEIPVAVAPARAIEAPEMEPPAPEPVQNRTPLHDIPAIEDEAHEPEKEPVIYCLCNGVLKRRVAGKQWGPSKNICCLCRDDPATSL
jgi:hypothetical protein